MRHITKRIKRIIGVKKDMGRPQTKRLKHRMYRHLQKEGPKTAFELKEWYNNTENYGSTSESLSQVLRTSILFEAGEQIRWPPQNDQPRPKGTGVGELKNYGVRTQRYWTTLWHPRPMDEVVAKAIKSKKPIKKFPHFLQLEIKKTLEGEE